MHSHPGPSAPGSTTLLISSVNCLNSRTFHFKLNKTAEKCRNSRPLFKLDHVCHRFFHLQILFPQRQMDFRYSSMRHRGDAYRFFFKLDHICPGNGSFSGQTAFRMQSPNKAKSGIFDFYPGLSRISAFLGTVLQHTGSNMNQYELDWKYCKCELCEKVNHYESTCHEIKNHLIV